MIMTKEILDQGMSDRGGWSGRQWKLLGINHNKCKGWKRRLMGTEFPDEVIREFISLKNAHFKTGFNTKKKNGGYISVNHPLSWEDQYKHPNWQRRRLEILKRDKFRCRICYDRDTLLHVHHLKYDKSKFIWDMHEIYLVTLCHPCHEKEHGRKL